jgi:hypothetical protein
MGRYKMRYTILIALTLLAAACTPDAKDKGLDPLPAVTFTTKPVEGKPHKIAVTSTTAGGFMWRWTWLNTRSAQRQTDTLSFPKKGEHTIQLTVFASGGYASATQTVTTTDDAPVKDILLGGDMEAGSEQHWTVLNTGGVQTSIKIENGVMKFSNTGNSNGAIYQKVKVVPGKDYTISAIVKGNGATNSWLEVYAEKTAPAQGKDYTGTKFIGLSTWDGCGGTPFDGHIAEIGCTGSGKGKGGVMSFNSSDSIYIVIKAGSSGGTLGTGITLDDIKFLEEQ